MKRSFLVFSFCAFFSGAVFAVAPAPVVASARPKLVDIGAGNCIPCRMMMPVLAELKKDYADQLGVVFIDVRKDRAAVRRYGIRVIPTQIFFNAKGEELFRHEGFYPKKAILAKWRALGIKLTPPPAATDEQRKS